MKFNKLPRQAIYDHLLNIIKQETIHYCSQALDSIIDYYDSDMRSMINTLQNNAYIQNNYYNETELYKTLFSIINSKSLTTYENKLALFLDKYNIEKKQFIIRFFFFLLDNNPNNITAFLDFYEVIIKTNIYSSKFDTYFYSNIKTMFKNNV